MPISTKCLVDKINTALTCDTLASVDLAALAESARTLTKNVVKVATETDLPPAADNIGRFIYVESLQDYLYSNGTEWTRQYDTTRSDVYILWSIGTNTGDGTAINRSSPVSVVGGFTDWCYVSSSASILSIRQNGTLWAWGLNNAGHLGDNTTINTSSPISVVGGFTDWCRVSAGRYSSMGLRSNGTIWNWACNSNGQIGDNTTINRSSPVSVVGGFTDWCDVSNGGNHGIALRTNGTIWAWGSNNVGQLGDNSVVSRSSPVSIVGGFTDWCQISSNKYASAAVRTNGTLWAWGTNSLGRLGDDSTVARSSPVSVVGGFSDWCQVSVGYLHMIGIRTNSSIWSWGCNGQGRLGDNTTIHRSSPVSIVGGVTNWCFVSGGFDVTHALKNNGTLWAWGCGSLGGVGDGTTIDRSSPVSVVGGITNWYQISSPTRGAVSGITVDLSPKGFNTP